MKNYIKYLILVQLIFISCVPQKFVKRALNEGKNSEYFYDVTIPENSMLSPDNLKAWYQKNENEYLLIDYKTRGIWFAGTQRTLVSWFAFVKKEDLNTFNAFQAEKLRQRTLEAKRRAEQDQIMAGIILGALSVAANSVSDYVDKVKTGQFARNHSTSYNSYSSRSQETTEKKNDDDSNNNELKPTTPPKCERENTYPGVKETGEWLSGGVGGDNCTITFKDGTIGNLFKSGKEYEISQGLGGNSAYYKNYNNAVRALYYFKKCSHFSPIGRE